MQRPSTPPDPSKVLEAALDVFVYAPIGFAFDAREVVPRLVERGRNQVALARLFGRYAMHRGQVEAERILNERRPAPSEHEGEPAHPTTTASAATPTSVTTVAPKKRAAKARSAAKKLPIPGYDSLSASQVVPRLDALRPHELETVRAHETANRARRTILNRIAQLQA